MERQTKWAVLYSYAWSSARTELGIQGVYNSKEEAQKALYLEAASICNISVKPFEEAVGDEQYIREEFETLLDPDCRYFDVSEADGTLGYDWDNPDEVLQMQVVKFKVSI